MKIIIVVEQTRRIINMMKKKIKIQKNVEKIQKVLE